MRLRRRTILGSLVALLALASPTTAATHQAHGWWWRAQSGLLGADVPPPPDVPEGGLLVEAAPDGPTAVSAVRFQLAERDSEPVLTLTVASSGPGDADIVACPTARTAWSDAQGGRWDARPEWDCDRGRVVGEASEDGSSWTWGLAPLVAGDGAISVVLLGDTATPSRVVFEAPDASSLATTPAPRPPPPTPSPEAGSPSAGDPQPRETSTVGPSTPTPPRVQGGAPRPPAARADGVAAPEVAAPTGPSVAPSTPAVAGPRTATPPRGLSPLPAALMGLVGGLVLSDLVASRGRRPAGRPWRASPTPSGGVGRFARPRAERPPPLW